MFISKKTSTSISWTQFVCSLIVILDHCFDYINYAEKEKEIFENSVYFFTKSSITGLTFIAMSLFFFFSSLLLYKDWNEKISIQDWYHKKIKSRFKSIFIPYLLWNLIWTIAFLIVGFLDNSSFTNITQQPTIIDFIDGIIFAKYNEVFWFMKVLIIYIIISPLIGFLISKFKVLILTLCFFLSVIPGLFIGELSLINNFHNIIFWILGAYISIHMPVYKEFCYSHVHTIINSKKVFSIFFVIIAIPAIGVAHQALFNENISVIKTVLLNSFVLLLSISGSIGLFNLIKLYFSEKKFYGLLRHRF